MAERTGRVTQRQTGRTGRVTAKSEGGAYDPESIAARWQGITGVTQAGVEGLGTIGGMIAGTGGASSALDALTGLLPADLDAEGGELIELYPEDTGSPYMVPLLLAGAGLGAYLLLRPAPKKKKKKKKKS